MIDFFDNPDVPMRGPSAPPPARVCLARGEASGCPCESPPTKRVWAWLHWMADGNGRGGVATMYECCDDHADMLAHRFLALHPYMIVKVTDL